MNRSLRVLLPSLFVIVMVLGGTARANGLRLTCTPDRVTIGLGETVIVHAWTDPPPTPDIAFVWTSSVGKIQSRGNSATWEFSGLKPQAYAATVRVDRSGVELGTCRAVVVIRSEASKGLLEARAFLVSGSDEVEGYGLYTYLLFGSRAATPEHKKRHLAALEALLKLDDVQALERYVKGKAGINIAYIPINDSPPAAMLTLTTDKEYRDLAEWIVSQYDYARAKALLSRLESKRIDPNGVYLVSDLAPLTSREAASTNAFFQDLTAKPSEYIWAHVQLFMRRTTQTGRWTPLTFQALALDTRAIMVTVAQAYDDVKRQLDETLGWTTKKKL